MDGVAFRPYRPGDRNFVLSSWRDSYRNSIRHPDLSAWIRKSAYHDAHNLYIATALDSDVVLVAVSPEDDDQILGWCAYGDGTRHYVYVKELYRRRGIGSALLAEMPPGEPTHRTPAGDALLARVALSGAARSVS